MGVKSFAFNSKKYYSNLFYLMELKINHRVKNGVVNVLYFNDFEVNLVFDSIASTFGFDFFFNAYNREQAEIACVSHFHECTLIHEGETLISGFLLSQSFPLSAQKEYAKFGGYSKTGVLEDSNIPPDLYPLQTDGLNLAEIAKKLTARFKIKVIVDPLVQSDMAKVIPKTTAEPTQTIKDYLTELAKQRQIIITHNEFGDLLFTKAKTELKPIIDFTDGVIGTNITLNFNGQGIHSHITVLKQSSSGGGNAGEYTIRNPYCPVAYVYRPKVVTQTSGDDITTEKTAKQELAAELKNITLSITTDRWKVDGQIIRPNNTISVYSPENFIYKKTIFFIESVRLKGDSKSTTAELTCVLPEVYNGKEPKNIFVDSHDNYPRIKTPKQNE